MEFIHVKSYCLFKLCNYGTDQNTTNVALQHYLPLILIDQGNMYMVILLRMHRTIYT